MIQRILLLTPNTDLSDLKSLHLEDYNAVALMFWSSPEFIQRVKRAGASSCFTLDKLIDDYTELVRKLYLLSRQYMDVVPKYRAINPFHGWETSIANALMTPWIAHKLHKVLLAHFGAGARVSFQSYGVFERAFTVINASTGCYFDIKVQEQANGNQSKITRRLGAFWNLGREAYQDGDLAQLFWTPLEVIDHSYRLRQWLWPPVEIEPGGIWCYSSYVNYTRALIRHTSKMVKTPRWVVGGYSGQKGLPPKSQWYYLWQFGFRDDRRESHRRIIEDARAAIRRVPEKIEGFPLRDSLSSNEIISSLLSRALPKFLVSIDLLDAFLEEAQPEQLWIANQWGGESFLAQLARDRGIPVTQVQHGILEQYYAFASIYSDRFLVWGKFWKEVVNPEAQDKVEIVNPGFEVVPVDKRERSGPARVTFFTAPLHLGTFWNVSVALWEVITLLDHLVAAGYLITIRVHPADRIDTWRSAWIEHAGALPESVRFDKGGSLEPVLKETDVAIMFHSTVFLNCVASGIPVISLGWYRNFWQSSLDQERMINFSSSMVEVKRLFKSASFTSTSGGLSDIDHFLDTTEL